LESDREALLLRKAIGESAFAVMQAEKSAREKSQMRLQADAIVEIDSDENVNHSNDSMSSTSSSSTPQKSRQPDPRKASQTARSNISTSSSSPTAATAPPTSTNNTMKPPKNMERIAAMLAKSESHALDVLEGRSHSPDRGLPDEPSPTKVNVNAPLPPIVIDSIKQSFNAHIPKS
jgi:hypothetical protein